MTQRSPSQSASLASLRELLSAAEVIVTAEWNAANATLDVVTPGNLGAGSIGLDRITQLGMAFIEYEQVSALETVLGTLLRLYQRRGGEAEFARPSVSDQLQAARAKAITLRVLSLGAFTVYRGLFSAVRSIVLQAPDPRMKTQYWTRETVTALARGGMFEPRSLVPPSADYIAEHGVLFDRFARDKDSVVTALCHFDFLQALTITHTTGDVTRCFPSFGAYFKERTEPLIRSLIDHGPPRSAIPDVADSELARLIEVLNESTAHLFFDVAGWERGWSDSEIREFLAKNT